MKRLTLTAAAACFAAGGLMASANANVVVSFPSFAASDCNSVPLTCVGHTTTPGVPAVLRLTPAAIGRSGAGYSTAAISLGAGNIFSTQFQFQFTAAGGIAPADGITFVLAASPTGLGGAGGGLGYVDVANSVAVEFDTFNNGSDDAFSSNHVAVDVNGVLSNFALANPYGISTCDFGSGHLQTGCMSNGHIWTANIGYDGTFLDVAVQDGANAAQNVIVNYAIDIGSALGTSSAFVGFTGGTGAGFENQDILNWRFADTTQLSPVPEPATLALLSLGLAGLGFSRRKKA